jgi:hypothetical protein
MLPIITDASIAAGIRSILTSGGRDKQQLRIAYLFLSAENRITDSDFVLFEEMGKSIEEFPKMKGEIIGECEKILTPPDSGRSRYEIVANLFSSSKESDESEVNRNCDILWTLLCLQYRNKENSEKKQQLIELWVEANRIDKAIVLEMCDTYETQNAISEYQKWLETNKDMSHQEFNSVMRELDKDLNNLQQSLSDLIAFA